MPVTSKARRLSIKAYNDRHKVERYALIFMLDRERELALWNALQKLGKYKREEVLKALENYFIEKGY